MNKKPEFSFRRLINIINRWIRANITRREHWLRISKTPISYADIDMKIEMALVTLARSFLDEELGKEISFKPKDKEGNVFYKGYRLHAVGDEATIDCCLNLIDAYNANQTIHKFARNMQAVKRREYRKRLDEAIVEFVQRRGHMWT